METLLKRHEDFENTLYAQDERLKLFGEMADKLISAGHYDSKGYVCYALTVCLIHTIKYTHTHTRKREGNGRESDGEGEMDMEREKEREGGGKGNGRHTYTHTYIHARATSPQGRT